MNIMPTNLPAIPSSAYPIEKHSAKRLTGFEYHAHK